LFAISTIADYSQANPQAGLMTFSDTLNNLCKPGSKLILLLLVIIYTLNILPIYQARALTFASHLTRTLDLFSATSLAEYTQRLKEPTNYFLYLLKSPPSINTDILLENTVLGQVKTALLKSNVSRESISLAIYISPEFGDFWALLRPTVWTILTPGGGTCWEKSFIIPAMTGFPLINGVRSSVNNCNLPRSYGLTDYNSESWNYPLSQKQVCDRAKQLGFTQVLYMTGRKDYSLVSCGNPESK